MAICQYFLKGTCKFGSSCRNEHPSGGFGKSSSFGGLAKSSFGSTAWQGGSANQETDKIIQSIKQDMQSWETSKIWPFSSFAPSKERPCLSDLKDYSPEEIRLEAYKAKESGTTNEYLNGIKQISDQFMKRRSELKSLTATSWNQELQKATGQTASSSGGLFQTQKSTSGLFSSPSSLFSKPQQQSGTGGLFSSGTAKQSLFGSTTGQSLFGQQSTLGSAQQPAFGSTQSVFGSGQSAFGSGQQSSFGSTQSAFGSSQQSSIGSGQSLFRSQQSAFGSGTQPLFASQPSASTSSLFVQNTTNQQGSGLFSQTPQTGKGLFSQQTTTPATPGLFGQQQQQQSSQSSGALFGQQQNTAPQQGLFTQQNLFGQASQQQQQQQQQQRNPFGQASTRLFGAQQTGSTQSLTPSQQPAVLQTAQNSTAAAPASQNPFMQAAMLQKQPQANVVAEVASTLKISEKDLEAFKADRFICGQVPECPPPPELC